jgi:SAM-dependent methyltransferase
VLGGETFDLVYTGAGALCWLPDVRRWAQTVAALLRPGGRLFIREGRPVTHTTTHDGNHRLGEIVTALIDAPPSFRDR